MSGLFNPCEPVSMAAAAVLAAKLGLLHIPVIYLSTRVSRRLFAGEVYERALAGFVVYIAVVAAGTWAMPVSYPWLLGFSLACGAAGIFIKPEEEAKAEAGTGLPMGIGLAVALMFFAALLMPGFQHDPMTYQLYHPAKWMQAGRVCIAPTPFGDPSHAYGPQLASTFYLWLMLPLHSDILARNGNLAFFVLTLIATSGLAVELGANRKAAPLAALLLFFSSSIMSQAASAMNDLAAAGLLAASAYFLLRASRTGSRAALAMGVAAAGLLLGVKYTGIILVVVPSILLVVALGKTGLNKSSLIASLAGAALAVGGVIWYLRNLILTGNPVYPIEMSILGHTILQGLYGTAQMKQWIYHQEGAREWMKIILANLSPVFLAAWVVGTAMMARRKSAIMLVALIPVLIDRLYWWAAPFQVDRFWIPALPFVAAAVAGGLQDGRWAAAAVGAVWAFAAVKGLPVGRSQGSYFDLEFIVPLIAPVFAGAALAVRRGSSVKGKWALAVSLGLIAALTIVFLPTDRGRRAVGLAAWEYGPAWRKLPCEKDGVNVAYTGANVPYPLFGPRLSNRVFYVGTAGQINPLDHEVISSCPDCPRDFHTPEPSVASLRICPRAWAESVSTNADYLMISRVPGAVLINYPHTSDDWPIEESWVRALPKVFQPIYQDDFSGLYKIVSGDRSISALPGECSIRTADGTQSFPAKYFPLAPNALKSLGLIDK